LEENEEESCGEKTHQLSRKHENLGTSSGSVKERAGKENPEPENSEERRLKTTVSKYRRKTNQKMQTAKGRKVRRHKMKMIRKEQQQLKRL